MMALTALRAIIASLIACCTLGMLSCGGGADQLFELRPRTDYRWDDSLAGADGIPALAHDADSAGWRPLDGDGDFRITGERWLWFRVKLPDRSWRDPVVVISEITQSFDAYYRGARIYRFGSPDELLSQYAAHLIDLPDGAAGGYLYLRMYSRLFKIGVSGPLFEIGERPAVLSRIVRHDADKLLLGFFFLVLGLAAFFYYSSQIDWQLSISLGALSLLAGIYTFCQTDIKQVLHFQNHAFWGAVEIFAFFLIFPALNTFYLRVKRTGALRMVAVCFRWMSIAVPVGAAVAAAFDVNLLARAVLPFEVFCVLNCCTLLALSLADIRRAERGTALFACGIGAFLLTAIFDVLVDADLLPGVYFYTMHYGLFAFVIVLNRMLARSVGELYRNLKSYADDLRMKNIVVEKAHLELSSLYTELDNTQRDIVYRLCDVIELRSRETGGHVRRVAEYTDILARGYGLPEEDLRVLRIASSMHDIGKLGVPDAILAKPGPLTDEEFRTMQLHTIAGYELLNISQRPIFHSAAIVAREHHEKFDGTGYPDRIAGDTIHVYGRIVAVADVFDSLSARRSYKEPWRDDDIFAFMDTHRREHFDPDMVSILLSNIDAVVAVKKRFGEG
ncbi:MAG TPA: HD domain-containing protein [Spirochaetota bacterium]|nr:HD domain-containing protein [Spirochaetota bacterium]HPI22457.1 HD domain-containing protein [Spirochaetota bacterium]HPU90066.1 HD domain-containing protein [Spirochaetota bacterium]